MLQKVKSAKAKAGRDEHARAKPNHSMISPKKLAPDTYSNIPPEISSNKIIVLGKKNSSYARAYMCMYIQSILYILHICIQKLTKWVEVNLS